MSRDFILLADDREVGRGCRMRIRARSVPGLLPLPCMLDIRNLPAEDIKRIQAAKQLAVCCGRDVLIAGIPADMVHEAGNPVTMVIFSPELPLWEVRVSLSLPAGIHASDAVRAILAASGTGIGLLSWTGDDPAFARGQAFCGRAGEAVVSVMESAGAKGVLMPAGLTLYREGIASGSTVALKKEDLVGPSGIIMTDMIGGTIRVLKVAPRALTPGMTITWPTDSGIQRGVLQEWDLDADTGDGSWGMECLIRQL